MSGFASRRQRLVRRGGAAWRRAYRQILAEQGVLHERKRGEDRGQQPGHHARRKRQPAGDQHEHAAKQQERPDGGIGQIAQGKAADRGGEIAVQPQISMRRDRQERRRPAPSGHRSRTTATDAAPASTSDGGDGDGDRRDAERLANERGDQVFLALLAIARDEARGDGRIAVGADQSHHGGEAGDGEEHAERMGLQAAGKHHLGGEARQRSGDPRAGEQGRGGKRAAALWPAARALLCSGCRRAVFMALQLRHSAGWSCSARLAPRALLGMPIGDGLRPGLDLPAARPAFAAEREGEVAQIFVARDDAEAHLQRDRRRQLVVAHEEAPFREMPVQHREADLRGVRFVGELRLDDEDAAEHDAIAAADELALLVPHLEGVDITRVVELGIGTHDARRDPGEVPAARARARRRP